MEKRALPILPLKPTTAGWTGGVLHFFQQNLNFHIPLIFLGIPDGLKGSKYSWLSCHVKNWPSKSHFTEVQGQLITQARKVIKSKYVISRGVWTPDNIHLPDHNVYIAETTPGECLHYTNWPKLYIGDFCTGAKELFAREEGNLSLSISAHYCL